MADIDKNKLVTLEILKAVKDKEDSDISELKQGLSTCLYIDDDGYICLKEDN